MIKSGSPPTETRFTFLKTKSQGCDATRPQNDVILGTHQLIDSRILTLKENHPMGIKVLSPPSGMVVLSFWHFQSVTRHTQVQKRKKLFVC